MAPRTADGALATIEALTAAMPRRKPASDRLADCRIVSHRGERDNRSVFENTFDAFDTLAESGVWGLELDVRWTRDLEPVVAHDADLQRVFGQPEFIHQLSLADLRNRCPAIPHLADFISRYAQDFHLMIELKAELYPEPARQRARLAELLKPLEPVTDFHILSLETALFQHVRDLPTACWLPVARVNVAQMSAFALEHGCAGFAGPYALITKRHIARHAAADQGVGVGFPAHRNVLYRELNRGVRWVFSNNAARLARIVETTMTCQNRHA